MFKDMTGQRFGMLTVVRKDDSFHDGKHTKWICVCDCGKTISATRDGLIRGSYKSCGCQMYKGRKGINSTHGMTGTRIHGIWASMNERCRNLHKRNRTYINRGITVCDEWKHDFMAFYKWAMENGYSDTLSIDRIDNEKGYSPDNCRWIPIAEQQANKSNTVFIMYNGDKRCLRTVCTEIGFPYKVAHRRYQRLKNTGKPITQEKLFEPIHEKKIAKIYRHP